MDREEKFKNEAMNEGNPNWDKAIKREDPIPLRPSDSRSDFLRDYNRILHCTAYSRLKHKTQVFYATENDHVCTRMEHVNHVLSISQTICRKLGLNSELVAAISIGHDLGHPPFGHKGEEVLSELIKKSFWHEKNSLHFVDDVETITNADGKKGNLCLTYAARDGIISHHGEKADAVIFPRENNIDLHKIGKANEYPSYTWEGCVVKIADKIASLGRDIEDANRLHILSENKLNKEKESIAPLIREMSGENLTDINNSIIIHAFIVDLCKNSDPKNGLHFSESGQKLRKELDNFSIKNIYEHSRLKLYDKYAKLIISSIYRELNKCYKGLDTLINIKNYLKYHRTLMSSFSEWLKTYTDIDPSFRKEENLINKSVYDLTKQEDYKTAIVDFISGMTDQFALRIFSELTSFA